MPRSLQTLESLCDFLNINIESLNAFSKLDRKPDFAIKVPLHFAQQMVKGDMNDPLLKQVLALAEENEFVEGFLSDPVGDLNKNPIPSLIHKYQGRALLIASPRCDIHCRYCFRRHFPYEQAKQLNWQAALQQIANDNSIQEVILSGGDPFTLAEKTLVNLIEKIAQIEHVTTLRIHSRTPVVAPNQAPHSEFLNYCQHTRLKVVLVVHCNHPNELSEQTAALFKQYQQAGITLLNQSVLLKGINNHISVLKSLSETLFQQGVLPYYCHLLDRVSGSHHFEVSQPEALTIFEKLRQQLPGYLMPKLVREEAGKPYKTPIF